MDSNKSSCGCGCMGLKPLITKSEQKGKKAKVKEAVEKKVKETK